MLNKFEEQPSYMSDIDYLYSRWKYDVKSGAACIGLLLVILCVAFWHDIDMILIINSKNMNEMLFSEKLLLFSRVILFASTMMLFFWILLHMDKPDPLRYGRYVFLWEMGILAMQIISDIKRPAGYYLSLAVEIPLIISMYIIIPQHKRILKIIPPMLFSLILTVIYLFHKVPPETFGFESFYTGILFTNIIGIYFSDEIYSNNRQLYLLSNLDELTGLYNRRYIDRILENEWSNCIEHETPMSICFIDIDSFKQYNDEYGHACGDKMLKNVASKIVEKIKKPGYVAGRYGGDEFLIIFPDTSKCECVTEVENIRNALDELRKTVRHFDEPASCTLSIGVATAVPNEKSKSNILIKQADDALFKAKRQGRNQTAVSD